MRKTTLAATLGAGVLALGGSTQFLNWDATATTTAFTFDDFGLTQPRVPVVLSVADTIRPEHQFTLTR